MINANPVSLEVCKAAAKKRSDWLRLKLVVVSLLAMLLAACSSPNEAAPTDPKDVQFGADADGARLDSSSLVDGMVVSEDFYVFVPANEHIEEVTFQLNNDGKGAITKTEPDYGMLVPVTSLPEGENTLLVTITLDSGNVLMPSFTFFVKRDGRPADPGDPTEPTEPGDPEATLPDPWQNQDIGSPLPGRASYSDATATFHIKGAGDDIWNSADNFHFVYQELEGDGEITARVVGIEDTHDWARAGVMIREKLTSGAKNAMVTVTPDDLVTFQYRQENGKSTDLTTPNEYEAPHWIRLARSGDTFAGYISADGETWELVGTTTIDMAKQVYVGLAVTSHDNTVLAEAQISDVALGEVTDAAPSDGPAPEIPDEPAPEPDEPAPEDAYYISPEGSDTQPGTRAKPWQTFDHALPRLEPGDTLVLMDGVYTRDTTGLIDINPATATNGTANAPITLRALHERQALVNGEGYTSAVTIENRSYWNIHGLAARNEDRPGDSGYDGHVFDVSNSDHISLTRVLAYWPNRYRNAQGIAIVGSRDVLVEGCEVYAFHRHGVEVYGSSNVTIRRCYVNSRNQPDRPGATTRANGDSLTEVGGDEAYVFYGSSNSIIENSITEGISTGFVIHGTKNGGKHNQVLGSINLNGYLGVFSMSREDSNSVYSASDNLYKNLLVIGAEQHGISLLSVPDTRFANITVYGSGDNGIFLRDAGAVKCEELTGGECGFHMVNALIWDSAKGGFTISNDSAPLDYLVEYSNLYGNGGLGRIDEDIEDGSGNYQNSMHVRPTGMGGAGPLPWIPLDSNLKGAGKNGADIGANILYRYENGVLTSEPLWDPGTGAFPCGAIYPGINDSKACATVHQRLNVTSNALAAAYDTGTELASTR